MVIQVRKYFTLQCVCAREDFFFFLRKSFLLVLIQVGFKQWKARNEELDFELWMYLFKCFVRMLCEQNMRTMRILTRALDVVILILNVEFN